MKNFLSGHFPLFNTRQREANRTGEIDTALVWDLASSYAIFVTEPCSHTLLWRCMCAHMGKLHSHSQTDSHRDTQIKFVLVGGHLVCVFRPTVASLCVPAVSEYLTVRVFSAPLNTLLVHVSRNVVGNKEDG